MSRNPMSGESRKLSAARLHKSFPFAFVILMLVAACQVETQANKQTHESRQPDQKVDSGADISGDHLISAAPQWKSGMAYADFQRIAINAGWSAVVDPQCRVNVIGTNYMGLCSAHPELDDCRVCDDMPELGSCSGDGYCGMKFSKQTQTLEVTTYGMTDDRKITGRDSRLRVAGWKVNAL